MVRKPQKFYTGSLLLAGLAIVVYLLSLVFHWTPLSGWLLMIGLLCLSVGIRGHAALRGLSFTVLILAVVSLAMHYPGYFVEAGGFRLSKLIIPLLQLIMFGMGSELSLADFSRVLRMPKGIFVGIVSHYVIMPLVGFAIASVFNFPPEIAAGIILVGCCPSGVASNVMAYLARANLALSVSVTTISTLLAPLLTPLLMQLLGGSYVEIDFWSMVWDITRIVMLPAIAGLLFNRFLYSRFKWLSEVMPLVSMAGIAIILVIITAAGRDHLLQVGGWLVVATLLHNLAGYLLGYWSARLFRFHERDCRTIALEVGMQNSGMASGLALSLGKLATTGLAPVVFGPVMNITGSTLASWWHHRIPGDDPQEELTGNQQQPSS